LNILPVSLLFIQESFQVLESVVYEEQENTIQGVKRVYCFSTPDIRKVQRLGFV